ncbi:MAG TPA: shikimate dehydrogenase [Rhodanobacteraceae bacterium]|jgi:shikimate dehydrogenase|nr:shikimate dehydrogenase [Rhodanobacteraceae bacterium]
MSRPQYAVFGQPIAHSLSPRIHAMFGAQVGIALDYRAIDAGRQDFAKLLEHFAREGGRGANVTLPLKQDALALCAEVSDRARRCGSANTLIRDGDCWRGDSTDGNGFLRDLRDRHAFEPSEQRCLLIGAGGAARAVAFALADAGVVRLVIANRTHERAIELARSIAAADIDAIEIEKLGAAGAFDLIVHATAAGHGDAELGFPRTLVASHTLCYDLSYGSAAVAFLRWARAAGATRASDGLGMLIEQAADSFESWHGQRPDTSPVFAVLQHGMGAK